MSSKSIHSQQIIYCFPKCNISVLIPEISEDENILVLIDLGIVE
jgi:hypothetical protein